MWVLQLSLHFQNYSILVPLHFHIYFEPSFQYQLISCYDFDCDWIESIDLFRENWNLNILSLHHWSFSANRDIYFVNYIPCCMYIVNGMDFYILFSNCSLPAFRNIIDFCILTLYVTLLISFTNSRTIFIESLEFSI